MRASLVGLALFGMSLGVAAEECRYEYSQLRESLGEANKIPTFCVEPFEGAMEEMNGLASMLQEMPEASHMANVPVVEQLIDEVKACPAEWQPEALAGFTSTVARLRQRTQEKGCHDAAVFAEIDAVIVRLTEATAASRAQSRRLVGSWRNLERAVREGHARSERAYNERLWGGYLRGEGPLDDIQRDNAASRAEIDRMVAESESIAAANRAAQAALDRAAAAPPARPPSAAPIPVAPKPATPPPTKPSTPPASSPAPPRVAGLVSPAPRPPAPAGNPKGYLTKKPITELMAVTDMWYQDRESTLNLAHTKLLNMASAYCDHNVKHTEIRERDRKCDQMESFGTTQYKCTIRAAVQCRDTPCKLPYCGADPKQQ